LCLVTGAKSSVKTVVYCTRVAPFLSLCHSSGVQAWSYSRGQSLISEQSMWNLWRTNGTGTGFCSIASVLPCHCNSTNTA
jgi:hypothetical protein